MSINPEEDPGWPSGLLLLAVIVPGYMAWRLRRRSDLDGLVFVRQVFVAFCLALVLFGVVLPLLSLKGGTTFPYLAVLAVVMVICVLLSRRIERPLDCQSPSALAGSYRGRFFARIAFAEAVAYFAFVFAFIGAPLWIYYLGAAFTLTRMFLVVAPTRRALAQDQQRLTANGCDLSLVAALRTTPPARGGGRPTP